MSLETPRFHINPALGFWDCLSVGAALLAMTPLQRVNVVVDDLTAFFIKAAACSAAGAIAWVRVRDSLNRAQAKSEAAEARSEGNTQEIARIKDAAEADREAAAEAKAAAAKATENAALAHEAARRVAAESAAKIAEAVVAAKAAAEAATEKAARAAADEIARLKKELERANRHTDRNTEHVKSLNRQFEQLERKSNDPDRSGPMTVVVVNDPDHPVPTVPQPPTEASGA